MCGSKPAFQSADLPLAHSLNWEIAVSRRPRLRRPSKLSDASLWTSFPVPKELPLFNQEYYAYGGYANSVDVNGPYGEHSPTWNKDI